MILLLDNYDSFTYNIVQYLQQLQADVVVYKNDAISLADIDAMQQKGRLQAIVLGPGPGTPDEAGITLACIRHFAGKLPLLGVCLGHQAIAQAFGASIVRAGQVMHGRTSLVYHSGEGVFNGLANPTQVTRYHSLLVDKATLPDTLKMTAWTMAHTGANSIDGMVDIDDIDEIMGIRHRQLAIEGVQFHPESILSEAGLSLLNNFITTYVTRTTGTIATTAILDR